MRSTIFLDALKQKNTSARFPVWIMRQAGRYLPNYQKIRQKYPLKTLFTNEEIASKVTLTPFEYFELDAAIIFWDILLIAEPLGFQIIYNDKAPPIAVQSKASNLIENFDYLFSGIKEVKRNIKIPLIGFCGAPFTVLSFLWKDLKKKIYATPDDVHHMLDQITKITIDNLNGQIKAGADAVQIFESSAHMLPPEMVSIFSTVYIDKILKKINCPSIVFGMGISQHINEFMNLPCNALGIDWKVDLEHIRKIVPPNLALQGNFDPYLLYAPKSQIKQTVMRTLKKMKNDAGWIANLGHGVLPDTPLDSVKYLIEVINNYDRLAD